MKIALLLILSILFFGMQTVALKKIDVTTLRENILETGLFSAVVAAAFWVREAAVGERIGPVTVGFGVLFGVILIATIACYFYAMQTGPLSYTAFFYSASMVIPALAGVLVWRDTFRWTMGVGIALFVAAFYLICVPGAGAGGRKSRRWMVLCFATFVLNGSLSVLVKAQQMATHGREAAGMTTMAFTSAFVLAVAVYVLLLGARKSFPAAKGELRHMGRLALPLLALAVGNGGGNLSVTWLSSRISSAYLFPTVLGGMMVGVTVYSVLALREKLDRFGAAGLLCGIAALVAINL